MAARELTSSLGEFSRSLQHHRILALGYLNVRCQMIFGVRVATGGESSMYRQVGKYPTHIDTRCLRHLYLAQSSTSPTLLWWTWFGSFTRDDLLKTPTYPGAEQCLVKQMFRIAARTGHNLVSFGDTRFHAMIPVFPIPPIQNPPLTQTSWSAQSWLSMWSVPLTKGKNASDQSQRQAQRVRPHTQDAAGHRPEYRDHHSNR